MPDSEICIHLSRDQALVLFEWLARSDDERFLPIKCPAEQQVGWKLEGMLEKQMPVFANNYTELVTAARARIAATN